MELFLNYYLMLQIPWNFSSITNFFATILKELKNRRIYCFLIMFLQLPFAAVAVLIPVCIKKVTPKDSIFRKGATQWFFLLLVDECQLYFLFSLSRFSPLCSYKQKSDIFCDFCQRFFFLLHTDNKRQQYQFGESVFQNR